MQRSNNPILKIALISLALSFTSTAMAKVYKWTDANGKTHYTATPPPAKVKAKTEEFKVQKIKKSSLTHKGYSESSNSTNTDGKSKKVSNNNAQSQCGKAVRKYPAVLSKLKRQVNKAKASGKMSDAEYKVALDKIKVERSKSQSISECVKDFKRGGKDKNAINLVANNSPEDALTYLMLSAAFEQAGRKYNKK